MFVKCRVCEVLMTYCLELLYKSKNSLKNEAAVIKTPQIQTFYLDFNVYWKSRDV